MLKKNLPRCRWKGRVERNFKALQIRAALARRGLFVCKQWEKENNARHRSVEFRFWSGEGMGGWGWCALKQEVMGHRGQTVCFFRSLSSLSQHFFFNPVFWPMQGRVSKCTGAILLEDWPHGCNHAHGALVNAKLQHSRWPGMLQRHKEKPEEESNQRTSLREFRVHSSFTEPSSPLQLGHLDKALFLPSTPAPSPTQTRDLLCLLIFYPLCLSGSLCFCICFSAMWFTLQLFLWKRTYLRWHDTEWEKIWHNEWKINLTMASTNKHFFVRDQLWQVYHLPG